MKMTDLSRSAVYLLMGGGKFPRPLLVSRRSVRWIESEVIDFILTRPRAGSERRRG